MNPRPGQPPERGMLVNVPRLVTAYFADRPDPRDPEQRVAFGTSGHRGSAIRRTFNEAHILATAQAICLYRRAQGIDGPLFLGMDTHALSEPAFASALAVLVANGVDVVVDDRDGYTPTPVVSHAIVGWNRGRRSRLADGVVITPSHNPPEDGGFKYNPPHGGPADTDVTSWIEARANAFLTDGLREVRQVPWAEARASGSVRRRDYVGRYVDDLPSVVDLDVVRAAGVRIGVDPLGGASLAVWEAVGERHRIDVSVVNREVDPTFRFMTVDWDGKIRMDCSSPYAMARLIGLKDRFDVAVGNDADADRHGIVCPSAGLLNPNHYLAVAVDYLFTRRTGWRPDAAVGKTVVTSAMIDRVAARLGRRVVAVPVGFKWFVEGLASGRLGFAGEESAGASLLRRDGSAWTTDKDGIVLGLLAAEIMAETGRDPGELYQALTREFGAPAYERTDVPATREEKAALQRLSADALAGLELAGEPIETVLTAAPGNGASIGGVQARTRSGWFAVRPSGTEDVYKIYAESFRGAEHLRRVQEDARRLIAQLVGRS